MGHRGRAGRIGGAVVAKLTAEPTADGSVRLTLAGESATASAEFWRAVLFDMVARESVRLIVSRHLTEPELTGPWWVGDGRSPAGG